MLNIIRYKSVTYSLAILSLTLLTNACGFQQYQAKPIDISANQDKYQSKDPTSPEFQQFLINNGYSQDQLPIRSWDLQALSYSALYFHPSLDVARAQWRAAILNESRAAERPLPNVNAATARSNQANQDINPYLYSLSIDVPIETADKRNIRIENARHLSEAAKLEIAQTAWQLRQAVAQAYYEYQFNLQNINIAAEELKRRQEIVAIYQKRSELGLLSNVELSAAKLLLQTAESELNNLQQNKASLLARLAQSIGLPVNRLEQMPLATLDAPPENLDIKEDNAQASALLNRLDIRLALARYAAAEAKVKMEIARQYPDIIISPGYAYEFGDKVWSLGLTGLLSLLSKNKAAIAEASQLREVEAAQFEALQNKVIAEVAFAKVEYQQAQALLKRQQSLAEQHRLNTERMQKRFASGEIDRLELSYIKLEEVTSQKNLLSAQNKLVNAFNTLENTLQRPIHSSHELDLQTLTMGTPLSPEQK